MENYIVVSLLSVVVVMVAIYGYNVDQRIFQIKEEFGNEIEKVKEKLKLTSEEISACHKEMIGTGKIRREEIDETKVNMATFKDDFVNVEIQRKNETNILKVELESMRKQINNHLEEMIEKDITYRKEQDETKNVITLHKETMTSLRETDNRFMNTLDNIKKEFHTQRPGFYVTLSSHTNLHQTQRIEFDQVITDVTNNYNKLTGIFTVPKNGLYHFSFTMFSNGGKLYAEIMQNHLSIGLNYGYSVGVSAAINVVISCKQGDSIFVRHMPGRGTQTIHGGGYSAFSGFLIY